MSQIGRFYEFEDFRLDLTNKSLARAGGENVLIARKMVLLNFESPRP